MQNIIKLLETKSDDSGEFFQLTAEHAPVHIARLNSQSSAYAAELYHLGIRKGDKVGLFFDNSESYLAVLFAIWRLNAVAVPLSPKSTRHPRFIKSCGLCKDCLDIKMLVHGDSTSEEVLIEWMKVCDAQGYSLTHFETMPIVSSKHVSTNNFKLINADDVAVIKIPNGINSKSEDVVLTHAMLLEYIESAYSANDAGGANETIPISALASNLVSIVTLPLSA